jgi:hypothetical protein
MVLVKAIRETKPAMKREDWKDHIKQYEKLKSQLNQRRNTNTKLNPFVGESLLPVLQPKSASMAIANERRILAFSQ